MRYAIVIPVKALNDFLRESLPNLLALSYRTYEVWLLPDGYGDAPAGRRVPVANLAHDGFFKGIPPARLKRLFLVPSGPMGPAAKRDLAARATKAEVLAFLDDDAWPRADWLDVADRHFGRDIVALGGPAITPPSATFREEASGLVFETWLGGGPARWRYRPLGRIRESDDWPTVNLLVRRDVFLRVGGFDNDWWPGEDTKFCLDLVKAGHRILYEPELVVWHHRRNLFASHLRQIGGYGLHRGHFARRFPETSARLSYFAPSILVLLVLLSWLPGLLWTPWLALYLSGLAFYLLAAFADAWRVSLRLRMARWVAAGVVLTHLWYGLRFLQGWFTPDLRSRLR